MSFLRWLADRFSAPAAEEAQALRQTRPAVFGRDSHAAVNELSRLLTERQGESLCANGAADISLALGNLFRAQGDIERAVTLREAVLADTEKTSEHRHLRGRTFFELGCDYRKAGFIDRAQNAFREAGKLGFSSRDISMQLAKMYADSGDFAAAAAEYARLDMPFAEAAFLVRLASETAASGKDDAALRFIRQALSVYPGSPEAWGALASMSLLAGDGKQTVAHIAGGLKKAAESGKLILLENFHAFATGAAAPDIAPEALEQTAHGVLKLLGGDDSIIMCYYTGLLLQLTGNLAEAEQCYAKTLVLDPDFWAARLALLGIYARREDLPPLLGQQVFFFTVQGARSKRFLCRPCGMRRETIFSECPRCRTWHSASFRMRLT
ncbi:tetratricopeptide repeat protein [Desulfovibrio sp. OttesenSCG-928-M14]|nr:tetratricopeptide repeat protein [Desulfovibrio sp. OttesenSCG-928-M14]